MDIGINVMPPLHCDSDPVSHIKGFPITLPITVRKTELPKFHYNNIIKLVRDQNRHNILLECLGRESRYRATQVVVGQVPEINTQQN